MRQDNDRRQKPLVLINRKESALYKEIMAALLQQCIIARSPRVVPRHRFRKAGEIHGRVNCSIFHHIKKRYRPTERFSC